MERPSLYSYPLQWRDPLYIYILSNGETLFIFISSPMERPSLYPYPLQWRDTRYVHTLSIGSVSALSVCSLGMKSRDRATDVRRRIRMSWHSWSRLWRSWHSYPIQDILGYECLEIHILFRTSVSLCKANPTWGDIFESSKLKAWTSLLPRFSEKRRSSFELWALEEHSKMWPQVGSAVSTYKCIHACVRLYSHVTDTNVERD